MSFFIDCISNLLNSSLTMLKLILRNKIIGIGSFSDDIWKLEKFINTIRYPFVDSSMQSVIMSNYNASSNKHGFINSLIVFGGFVISFLSAILYYKFDTILKYLNITNSSSILKYIYMGYVITIPILFIYTIFFTISSLKHRSITSICLFIGNIVFTSLLLLGSLSQLTFINNIILWIIGNILYAFIPLVICGYLFCRYYWQSLSVSIIPMSFFIGTFNIYWQQILGFIINQFIINKMQNGDLSLMNIGYKMSDIITKSITKPLMRNVINETKSANNTCEYNIVQSHNVIIFPVIYFSINLKYICGYFNNIANINIVIISCLGYFISTYFQTINTIINTYILTHLNQNTTSFLSSTINLIIRPMFMLMVFRFLPAYQVMIVGYILSSITECIFLIISSNVQLQKIYKQLILKLIISVVCGLTSYIICQYIHCSKIYLVFINMLLGIIQYITYLYLI